MAAELASNTWGIINHHQQQGILELRWLPSTAEMTDDDFKATLVLFAEQAERTGTPLLLIDAVEFRQMTEQAILGDGHPSRLEAVIVNLG